MRKKNKRTTEYDKSIVTCDINTTLYETGTIKCEEKKRELSSMKKVQSHMILVLRNVRIVP